MTINLLLFFVPFALFALYVVIARRRGHPTSPQWPWITLTIAGVAAVAVGFVVFRLTSTFPTDSGHYVPASIQDGQFVPGHYEKDDKGG